jgi:uncharacterized protein (DUF2062 family)
MVQIAVKLGFWGTVWLNLSGGISAGNWASMCVFYCLGVILTIGLDIVARNNREMPLSLKYWFADKNNRVRLAIMPVAAFMTIRFASAWFPFFTQNMEFAALLGLAGDTLFISIRAMRKKFRRKIVDQIGENEKEVQNEA